MNASVWHVIYIVLSECNSQRASILLVQWLMHVPHYATSYVDTCAILKRCTSIPSNPAVCKNPKPAPVTPALHMIMQYFSPMQVRMSCVHAFSCQQDNNAIINSQRQSRHKYGLREGNS